MSDLQISLLGIGVAVIVAVYLYNLWLERQYKRHYGDAFRRREDALYHGTQSAHFETLTEVVETAKPAPAEKVRGNVANEACELLDEATDFIVEIYPIGLVGADALQPLWQRRFDFGKNVNACGLLAESGSWEKVIAESHVTYSAFRMGLQLSNRSGAVNLARLSDFSDLAREIGAQLQADFTIPDAEEAAARAIELDAFCAELDQMIGLNLLPNGEITLGANEVAEVMQAAGMKLQADGAFHLPDAQGHTIFSVCNVENNPFQHHTFNHMRVKGLTLLLDVPRVEHPVRRFDEMVTFANMLGKELGATVVDDHKAILKESGLAQIREQIELIETRMQAANIEPGSAQARRLFS